MIDISAEFLMFWLQGLGNKFLSHIREVDSILQVRNF